ncbi:unnamed protein product [Heligmosomoides polygyrus]|uniref:Uncharacterized protein n=1 Tax=Heligmosomoides polygyrus TaxID=6339 RepID=A0A183GN04_HELPZ|nr:unnamed protein product [Heligmosomoides polygyrus]
MIAGQGKDNSCALEADQKRTVLPPPIGLPESASEHLLSPVLRETDWMAHTRLSNPDDADDSDSSDSSDSAIKVPRRSATVSPSARTLLREHPRRRSDFNLYGEKASRRSMAKNSREPSVVRRRLRKTNSEPNVEGVGVVRWLQDVFCHVSSQTQS